MATIQYARLYPDTTQLQAKDGHNLTAGWVEVYLAGTDDPAVTYADFNGTRNPQRIIVDDNGRFCAIVDKSKAYRVEVYDADGMLQWTTEPVWCTGNAGAGMSVTRVVSTDGSIAVEESIDGSERTYDLSIAPSDSDEFLEWIKCSEEDCGSTWHPVYQAGTMETEAGQGIKVHAGQLYHFTNTFYVDPDGTGINYDTFKVLMYCNGEIVDVRDFDIDSSLNDSVMCEFSTDLIPSEDGFVYYKLTIPSTCEVTAEVQCHRIYSGINAVPDTCATKQWVQETFDYNMAEKISYSALEYNGSGYISGISGSAIAGGLDSATVSAIASSYAESAISSISGWSGDFSSISSKIDWSSSGVFQPSGDYQTAGDYAYNSSLSSKADQSAFEQCCDEVHSALDEKLDKSASSEFQPSGQYVYESSYSSFSSEVTNNISSLSSTVSGISADMSAYVPFSGLEGEGGKVTGISGSAFKGHEYTGIYPVVVDNVEDTISVEHRTLCVDSTMTAYNSGSSAVIGVNVAGLDLSSKMDASASSLFYSTSNPSGFLTAHQSLAGYATEAYVDSSVSSKLDTTAFSTVSGDFLTSHQSLAGYATESYVDSAVSGKLDVTASSQFLTSLPDDLAYTSDVASAVSGKMDKSESSSFYPMDSNPSGYLTAHQSLAGYATEGYVDSAVSGKLDATAYDSAEFYTTANESGFVDSAYVESQVSGKQDTLTFDWDSDSAISSINGSALAGQGGGASIPFNGYYYDSATSATVEITADVASVGSVAYKRYNGNFVNTYSGITDTLGLIHLGVASFIAPGAEINGVGYTLAFAPPASMWKTSDVATGIFAPLQYGTGAGMFMDNNNFKGYLKGNEWFVSNTAYGYARGEVHNSRGSRVIVEHTGGAGAVLSARGSQANVTLNSTAYGTARMAIANSQAYVQVQRGNSAYKYNSAKLDTDYLKFYAGMVTGYLDPEDTASGTAYMPAETEYMYISSIPYWNAKLDASAEVVTSLHTAYGTASMGPYVDRINDLRLIARYAEEDISGRDLTSLASTGDLSAKLDASAIECDTASAITAIGGSAIAGGGIDSATCSAIASSYAESATSGKVDQSAYDNLYSAFTALNDLISTYSAYFSSISAKVDNSAIGVIE